MNKPLFKDGPPPIAWHLLSGAPGPDVPVEKPVKEPGRARPHRHYAKPPKGARA